MLFNWLLNYFSTYWGLSCFTTLVRQLNGDLLESTWLTAQSFPFVAWTLRGHGSVFVGSRLKSNYHRFYNNTSLLCVFLYKSQDFLRAGTEAKTKSCIIIGFHLLSYFMTDECRAVFDSMMTAAVCQGNAMLGGPHPLLSRGSSLVIIFQWLSAHLIMLLHWMF